MKHTIDLIDYCNNRTEVGKIEYLKRMDYPSEYEGITFNDLSALKKYLDKKCQLRAIEEKEKGNKILNKLTDIHQKK